MKNRVDTEKKNINYYSKAVKNAEQKDFIEFLKWFNGGENIISIINSGYYDFFSKILKPIIYEKTKNNSKQLICLEIGCGGGRILNAACKYFGKAIGTDIHNSFNVLNKFLSFENNNFELKKITNNKIPVADKSIDFIYSFIVFQHILKITVFKDYLSEIKRILKNDGVIIIYFGRPRFFSKKQFKYSFLNFITFTLDRIFYESIFLNLFKKGYSENYNVKVNHVNLTVSLLKAKKMFKKSGFEIKEKGYSKNNKKYGTQYYFIAEHK